MRKRKEDLPLRKQQTRAVSKAHGAAMGSSLAISQFTGMAPRLHVLPPHTVRQCLLVLLVQSRVPATLSLKLPQAVGWSLGP